MAAQDSQDEALGPVRAAIAARNWPTTLAYATEVMHDAPDESEGPRLAGLAHRMLGQFAEAETVLLAGNARFPDAPWIAIELTAVALDRGAFDLALTRSANVRKRFPLFPHGVTHALLALLRLGRAAEAEEIYKSSPPEMRRDTHLYDAYYRVALARRDVPEARRRLSLIEMSDPSWPDLQGLRKETEELAESARYNTTPMSAETEALFSRFESLGSSCEFGLLQRYWGAEPLGLLRWASTDPSGLAKMLRNRFPGIGKPETLVVRVDRNPEGLEEYFVGDGRFFQMHAHIAPTAMSEERVRKLMSARIQMLSGKLLDDLYDGEKIFVFKDLNSETPEDEFRRIAAALHTFPRSILLGVRKAYGKYQPWTLRHAGMRLIIGYVDYAENDAADVKRHADQWLGLCRQAAELARDQRVLGAPEGVEHAERLMCLALDLAHEGLLAAALATLERLRTVRPDFAMAYSEAARLESNQGHPEAALSLFSSCIARCPPEPHLFAGAVEAALQLPDYEAALRNAIAFVSAFPNHADGHRLHGLSLRLLGRLDEAEAILAKSAPQFRLSSWLAIEHASVALDRGDLDAALRRATDVRKRFPTFPEGVALGAKALRLMGRHNEAEEFLAVGLTQVFPTAITYAEHVRVALARRDLAVARTRAEHFVAAYSDNTEAKALLDEARSEA